MAVLSGPGGFIQSGGQRRRFWRDCALLWLKSSKDWCFWACWRRSLGLSQSSMGSEDRQTFKRFSCHELSSCQKRGGMNPVQVGEADFFEGAVLSRNRTGVGAPNRYRPDRVSCAHKTRVRKLRRSSGPGRRAPRDSPHPPPPSSWSLSAGVLYVGRTVQSSSPGR